MNDVIFLAVALAMDAFAVSIGMGAKQGNTRMAATDLARPMLFKTALVAGLYFGIAQGVMPLIGYLLGFALLGWLAAAAPWIGCLILVGLGAKMLYEAVSGEEDEALGVTNNTKIDHRLMTSLAIATSIDAMAAGFTLNLLAINAVIACIIIAVITAVFSVGGVYLGRKSGTWFENKAEILGGVVLIAIGIKMVL